jgi:copper ion binding protein
MRREARTFQVSGMHGAGCVGKVEAALGELPGVVRVAINLEPGLARVDFDGDRASPEAIAPAISGLGYQVAIRLDGEGALDREQGLRQAELRRQTRSMRVAWPLALVANTLVLKRLAPPSKRLMEPRPWQAGSAA